MVCSFTAMYVRECGGCSANYCRQRLEKFENGCYLTGARMKAHKRTSLDRGNVIGSLR